MSSDGDVMSEDVCKLILNDAPDRDNSLAQCGSHSVVVSGSIIWSTRSTYQHLQNLWSGKSQPLLLCNVTVRYATQGVSKVWPLSAEDRDQDIKYFQALCLIEGPHGVILRAQMHDGPDFLLNMYFDWVQSPNWHGPCGKKVCLRVQSADIPSEWPCSCKYLRCFRLAME